MDTILLKFLNDEYKDKIEYNKKIKELNNILDKILYLCNNINYKRIKNLYINIIENYNYYNEEDGFSKFENYIDTKETKYNDEEIEKNHQEINKQIKNFEKNNNEFKKLEYYKKDNITDFQYQNNYLINKLNNIISTLNILDEKDENDEKDEKDKKENINFNIYLINKNSFLNIFIGYHILKNGLLKNLHFIKVNDTIIGNEEENEEKNEILKINKKLNNIYITKFNERIKKQKKKIEGIKDKIEGLKKNIPIGDNDIPLGIPIDDTYIPVAKKYEV